MGDVGKYSINNNNHIQGVVINEVDEGQPCLICEERCPGFIPHVWRKSCVNCKCARYDHDIYNDGFVNISDRIGWQSSPDTAQSLGKDKIYKMGYTWAPLGLAMDRIDEYMDQLPNDKVPRRGSQGEKYRDQQITYQLPRQDLCQEYCRSLKSAAEKKNFRDFVELRNELAMGLGVVQDYVKEDLVCHKCEGLIEKGDMAVFAPKVEAPVCWHPACFVCNTCDELLVDLVYCQKEEKLYCQRHFAEIYKPRCEGCDELIFAGEYTKAMEQDWHSGHFACATCDNSLTGQRYILKEEKPYCIKCYVDKFANTCEECKEKIGTDSKDLSYKDKHWHEKCFFCCDCKSSLVDKPFAARDERLHCADCYDNNFAARCDGCSDIFRAGMKKFEYKGKQWHEHCFCCLCCKQPIGNKSFIPRGDDVVCTQCYEDQFAMRCMKCQGAINKGGVTYKGDPWHRECFTCTNCDTQLAGQKFTSKDDKPYCADCFGELFAKKCCRCTKPITGIGGTKFISFEDRHWHSSCFNCYQCNTSLVGRGFLTKEMDILCPQCGR
ncbi:four and a half LIM domains protein 3 isoform X2 [Lingula anatina]|uniref:Four and a half LIM domains protein 3 isoform X2 n=1 Tax=Lingula anatina TaxID=7574 RepID=A0A1S3ISJ4_LINAN|nr:four and a half LIM domains protein 3 isoform X2 [Lingula anatina]|eukprot:XP_013401172.1 four and a half LIM domains protein 3 isoform X2 [Lingula anatina]